MSRALPDDLVASLAAYADRDAIRRAMASYFDAVERRDWDGVAEVFVADASLDYGTPGVAGVTENIALLRAGVERFTSASTLLGMQCAVTVDGDRARSMTAAFTAHSPGDSVPGPARARMSIVRYEDDWIRTHDGGWRVTRRVVHHDLKGWLALR
jgi:ketosteroid isomerase-like protein